MLRKRIPTRYQAVSGHTGNTIKISTGTADRKLAERRLPKVLEQWAEKQAEWERKLNVVSLSADRAQQIAAQWAAWIASGAKLETAGIAAQAFHMLAMVTTPETVPAVWARVEAHADEALFLAGITITPETRQRRYAISGQDGEPMAFAGLWEGFKWPDRTVLRSLIIVTTNANADVAALHDLMPVILEVADWPAWLGEVEADTATLLHPSPEARCGHGQSVGG